MSDRFAQALINKDKKSVLLEMKSMALTSLYYCAKVILGYRQLTDSLHLPLCLKLHDRKKRKLYEWPRGHFKTTIASKSFPIWRALPLDDDVREYMINQGIASFDDLAELERLHDVNRRILLISSTDENAKKILRATRWQFENNELLRTLWPEILPKPNSKWNDNELCLNRGQQHSESTFEALGVGGALQSRHYDIIIEDDLVGKDAIESESVMKKVVAYHQLIDGAFDNQETAENIVIGNRWSFNDLNSWIRDNEQETYEIYTRSAIENEEPIFPERFSLESFARIRQKQGDYFFSCQYLNDPIAPGATDFEKHWLKTWKYVEELTPAGDKAVVLERSDKLRTKLDKLNKYLLIDPAREGKHTKARHAVVCVGLDADENIWILKAWAEKCTTDMMLKKAFEFYEQLHCQKAGIEGYGGDAHLKNYMNYMARTEKKRMSIVVFNKSTDKSKEERIRAMQTFFELGKVAVQEGELKFTMEYSQFPNGQTVDILDAFAHGPEVWRRPLDDAEQARLRAMNNRLLQSINKTTGY